MIEDVDGVYKPVSQTAVNFVNFCIWKKRTGEGGGYWVDLEEKFLPRDLLMVGW